ncbi:MAG: PepSY domain-containing protein [Steroidobacteraceae bacterium]
MGKLRNLVRYVIFTHRYLGILICLLCVSWFASGIVMMYAGGMPRVSAQQRLEALPALDLANVKLTPAEAVQQAGMGARAPTLTSVLQRPAYSFQGRGDGATTVFADTGEVLKPIDIEQARKVASRFTGQHVERVQYVRTLEQADQWTMMRGREVGLFKFEVDDGKGTELYVSPASAEVAQLTTRNTRLLAWIGVVPHWIYFTALKTNQPVWYKVVVWTSTLACVVAVLGLILGYTQFRKTTPFNLKSSIPYRGWLRWHYITGTVFGVFVLTWAFSGMLSMEPFDWTNARGLSIQRDVFSGGSPQLQSFNALNNDSLAALVPGRTIKEIEFTRIQDENYYSIKSTANTPAEDAKAERLHQPYVVDRAQPDAILVNASTLQPRSEGFSVESLLKRLQAAVPDTPIVDTQLLTEYDSYYYSRGRQQPLPILRVKFGDPMQTWVYVDPQRSAMLTQVHRYSRIERWLYNGLHSLDFKFWYSKRPLWDIGMIILLLGGLATSVMGVYLGIKRLRRDLARVLP